MPSASSEQEFSVSSSTTTANSGHQQHQQHQQHQPLVIGHRENRWVIRSRGLVFFVLAVCASLTGILTYKFTADQNERQFESEFIGLASQIVKVLQQAEANIGSGLDAFAECITSTKQLQNGRWPNYLVPDLERQGQKVREAAGVHSVEIVVQVEIPQIESFNSFLREGIAWYNESLALAGLTHPPHLHWPNDYLAQVNQVNPLNSTIPEAGESYPGPFHAIVQSSPPRTTASYWYNVALPSLFAARFQFMNQTRQSARSTIVEPSNSFLAGLGTSDPMGLYYQPLFEDFSKSVMSAFVYGIYSWNDTLSTILDDSDGAVYVVVEAKSCNRTATYWVQGSNATFLGMDPHLYDSKYERYGIEAGLSATLEEIDTYGADPNSLSCHYSLRVYPTNEFRNVYENNDPLYYTLVVLSIFAFTTLIFLGYDWLVQVRQDTVMDTAVKTDAIVNQMFPPQFRDQLFDSESNIRSNKSAKSYLGDFASGKGIDPSDHNNCSAGKNRPVADLFPHATIMFADIGGFTAWSSSRDAIQVFQLLEAIYGSFDEIAKKRRVYKVETVGDSYVAACGVPIQRKDHAVTMVRFARDCMMTLAPTVMNLERTLGPGTGDIRMRFGLHSGPVTAGVLRGERARFQLFGTTVNTASRIESTGKTNQIHLSEQTAELLIAAGKSDWIVRREDKVVAKGLGELTTYWAKTRSVEDSPRDVGTCLGPTDSSNRPSDSGGPDLWLNAAVSDGFAENSLSENTQRLIVWNVELLTGLLEQVVASRKLPKSRILRKMTSSDLTVRSSLSRGREQAPVTVLDEVAEIIKLPDFESTRLSHSMKDPAATAATTTTKTTTIDPKVKEQLSRLVSAIAMSYRNNPFHNFEHASHVAMSVQKLLSRIIAPEIELKGPEDSVALALHDHTYGITSDPLTQFAVVLSALIHDVDHRGVPNGQLAKEDPALAAVYRNQSIAEQNSVDIAWSLFEQDDLEDLQACIYTNPEERSRFRQILINCVMATDIFDMRLSTLRKARWNAAFAEDSETEATKNTIVDRNRKATIVIEHLIQASDVAHTMQHWHVYRKWNEKLFVEMYVAWKSARAEKNPADGWYKGELWFFDNYVIPLAKKLDNCGVFGVSSDEYLSYAVSNRREWEMKGQRVVAEMLEKLGH